MIRISGSQGNSLPGENEQFGGAIPAMKPVLNTNIDESE